MIAAEARYGRGQHAGERRRDDVADLDPAQFSAPGAPPDQLGPLGLLQGPPRFIEDERSGVGDGDR
jgi:hypothetical protein